MNIQNETLNKILFDLSNSKEGAYLEFKESYKEIPREFWKTYSAFANTSGGFILLGVRETADNSLLITGVEDAEKLIKNLVTTAQNKNKVSVNLISNEDISVHDIGENKIIAVYIREASISQKPVYLNGEDNYSNVYIRKYEGDCHATQEEYRRFIRNTQDNIDEELLNNYNIEDLDERSILEFKNIINLRYPSKNYLSLDNLTFLIEMGIFQIDRNDGRKPKLTLAGLLFLGKYDAIRQRLPHFHLEYFNKRCDPSARWKDRVSTGDLDYHDLNLFQFYKIVLEKLKTTIDEPFELDQRCVRKSSAELDVALREALANSVIHADYLDAGDNITITVEPLFYTFLNPGTMKISKAQFFIGGQSKPRNNMLISFFRRMGASERAGSGGKEIFDVVEKNKFRSPELETDIDKTYLKLWCASPESSYNEYSENTRKVLLFIREKQYVKISDLKANIKLTSYQIYKALNELLEDKLITTYGKSRATTYIWQLTTVEKVAQAQKIRNMLMPM